MGDATTTGQIVLGLATIITTIAGFIFQYLMQKRKDEHAFRLQMEQRKQDLEDRELARAQMAAKVITAAKAVANVAAEGQKQVMEKLEETKSMNQEAISAANNFNLKLAAHLSPLNAPYVRRVDDILADTAMIEDTNERVKATQETVKNIDRKT